MTVPDYDYDEGQRPSRAWFGILMFIVAVWIGIAYVVWRLV